MIERLFFLTVRKIGDGEMGGLEPSDELVSFASSSSGFPHAQNPTFIKGSSKYNNWFK